MGPSKSWYVAALLRLRSLNWLIVVVHIFTFFSLTDYSEKYFRKLTGNSEIEDSLERLDKMTQEEARMASAEQLKMTCSIDDRVRGVGGQVKDVRDDVQDVRCDVQDARGDLRDVANKVQDVDDKLDQASRSSSF